MCAASTTRRKTKDLIELWNMREDREGRHVTETDTNGDQPKHVIYQPEILNAFLNCFDRLDYLRT